MPDSTPLPETMRAWRVHEWGENPTEALQLDTLPLPQPQPGEVMVRVEGIALNLNDLERINGENMMVRPELPCTPGMEVMGTIAACGDGVPEDHRGRRVVATTRQATGGFAEYACGPATAAFDMPEDIAFPEAAALYFPFHLAWLGLVDRAELKAGESVLIHAAAGGAGSAAVQLAKSLGATVYATCGGAEKVKQVESLGADVVIDYTSEDFKAIVLEKTANKGVDVVFDGVGEAVMDDSMACTGYNGRYLMMGFASDKRFVDEKFIVPRKVSAGNFRLCGVLLSYANPVMAGAMKQATGWNFAPDSLGAQITAGIVEKVRAGDVKALIGEVVEFDALPEAMTRMRDRGTTGRVVVRVGD
ncbi:MAG: alcohol dehydrogenase [Deltaproteobacteria bacterium]|nr:alcohol dehydrogenase [Deltaproteobacteria bacterium]